MERRERKVLEVRKKYGSGNRKRRGEMRGNNGCGIVRRGSEDGEMRGEELKEKRTGNV